MTGRPTMDDVARAAGVSRALVSLVMNGSDKVSDRRRDAVVRAARSLGYSPHMVARALASRTSTVIGVLISDLHNTYFAEVVDGIEETAQSSGFDIVINSGGRSAHREQRAVNSLLSFRPAGLVLLSPVVPARAIAAAVAQTPVALVGRSTRLATVDTVNDHGQRGSTIAVDHLVELGHRRICHLDGGHGAQATERRQGYLRAMRLHRLEPQVVSSEFTDFAGADAVHRLLADTSRPRPTALVAANDLNAVGAISALEEAGLRTPDDMSVVGYDNTALAALRHISLTTIDQPRADMGRLAAQALIERLRGERTTPVRHRLSPSLVIRRTTAPADG
ncbi:MAG: LacI family transcriptional regulator [Actinomycetota bacterium]|nr:LacI family transcriptional regulator [Actinomycetota bacterium]